MALFKGHQLGRVLVQNIWKVLGAFGLGVVAVVGGGLILSNVHTIPQTAPLPAISGAHSFEKLDGGTGQISGEDGQRTSSPSGEPLPADASGSQAAAQNIPAQRVRKRHPAGNTEAKVSSPKSEPASDSPPALGFALQPQAAPAQLASAPLPVAASALTLPVETPISVRLSEQLSSKANHKGQFFKGTLATPLQVQGIVVAEAGASVTGRVVDARSPRFFKGGSNLNLELTQVRMADGRLVPVQTTQWFDTGAHSRVGKAAILPGEAAKKVASSMKAEGDGAPASSERTVAPESADTSDKGERKGSSVVLPPGSEIVFRLVQPLTVNEKQEHR